VNKFIIKYLIVILGAALALPASAEEVNESIDAASDGHVEIINISGSVEVFGWSRNSVEVTGEIGEKVEELIVERNGDKVLVKVKVPRNSGNNIASDLTVRVPSASSIDVSVVSADIDVEDVKGEQSLHTVSGDVETTAAGSDVSAQSVSGDVDVSGEGNDAEISATTVSGDVTLSSVAGTVSVEAVSGDLTIDGGSFDRATLNSVNGEIYFLAGLRKDGRLTVETVNGDVDVLFSGSVSAKFDIETFNGDIENCFGPKATRTSKYAPGWELSFTEGSGEGRVEISTLNGDMEICND